MSCSDTCNINELKRTITIESESRVSDGIGGNSIEWLFFATARAKIEPMKTSQVLWSQQLQHRITHKITIRYRAGLKIDMRILYDGRIFYVRGFRSPNEEKRWLEITAEEGTAS